MAIVTYYCTPADVANFLSVPLFSSTTVPTDVQVGDLINMNEEYIESETMNAWREKTASDETHTLDYPQYQLRDGTAVFLTYRNVFQFDSATDKIEVWNGEIWEDYLTTRTEGRQKDYWVDYKMGVLWIRTFPRTVPRDFAVRVTYRYGNYANVPKQIKKCAIYLTATDILQSDDRSILLPEGTTNLPYQTKLDFWWSRAKQIIESNTELKVVAMS